MASFLLSHPHENIASIPSAGLPWAQTCWRSLRRTDDAGQKQECVHTIPILRLKESGEMPRGDKSKYTEKQKRQAEHIEEGYEQRGVPEDEAERRA